MIIDGRKLATDRELLLKQKIDDFGLILKLVVLVLADDKAGLLYSELKKQASKRVGISLRRVIIDSGEELVAMAKKYGRDEETNGLVIQYPGLRKIKKHNIDWSSLVKLIDINKDVDGLREDSGFMMGAVKAVVELVKKNIRGYEPRILVVGGRGFVGKKMVRAFKDLNFRVKEVEIENDLESESKKADILISCTGRENLIKAKMVKEGAMVIDVGWPKGDVDFKAVFKKAGLITPVPGGVGPLTVIYLLENLVSSVYSG